MCEQITMLLGFMGVLFIVSAAGTSSGELTFIPLVFLLFHFVSVAAAIPTLLMSCFNQESLHLRFVAIVTTLAVINAIAMVFTGLVILDDAQWLTFFIILEITPIIFFLARFNKIEWKRVVSQTN